MSSLPCPPQHWERFSELLDSAMDVAEPSRGGWLDSLAGPDAELRPWLARVLGGAAAVSTGDFLHCPKQAALPGDGFQAGDHVGPYQLESLLGEGGMGQVWRASRLDDGPRREVALKLPQPELLGTTFRARFRREQDVLAALSHAHVAQLYDAGISAEGHPYLALELVEGKPITEHCRATRASVDRRLELMREVLAALSYAHARLIVHRDIKPNNVLVTVEGDAKLLDFGIAKLLRADEAGDLMLTQPAALLATPGYAAPEQLAGGTVTVAADVFSAGVLLFELLTGERPFVRVPADIDAEAAPLASQRADAGITGSPEGVRLRRLLRGDLDAVVARALALDPRDRYGSAEAFSADLRRCREGLPVSARRIGWPVLTAKFVRRNKIGVGLGGVLVVAIAAGVGGVSWQAQRAKREAAHAEHEASRANAIKDFLINLFEQGDPRVDKGKPSPNRTATELLDAGAEQAHAAFARDPETEIELLSTLGNINDSLGDTERSDKIWAQRLNVSRALYGAGDPRVIDATTDLAWSHAYAFREDDAKALMETIRPAVFTQYGPASLQRAEWLMVEAQALRATHGAREEATADAEASVAILQKNFPGRPEFPQALLVLASYRYDAERYQDAVTVLDRYRDAEVAQKMFDPMDELAYRADTATSFERLGRTTEADQIFAKGGEQVERVLGRRSEFYVGFLNRRAEIANLRGERDRGDAMYREALAISQAGPVPGHAPISPPRSYGDSLAREGRVAEALPFLEAAIVKPQQRGGAESWLRHAQGALGDAYDQLGRTDEARKMLLAARDGWVRYGPQGGAQALGARERWARFLLDHGETGPAVAEFDEIVRIAGDTPSAPAALAEAGLARVALAGGDNAGADAASARAMRMLELVTLEYDFRARPDVWMVRADTLLALGRKADAASLANRALQAARDYDAPGSGRVARAQDLVRRVGQAA